jgi:predicted ATP-grasp superfamily ATP-dependent carboligase
LIPFPCILKPQAKTAAYTAAGGKKAYVIDDLDSLRSTYASFCDVEPRVVIQQFIPGGDDQVYFCLQACAADGSPILPFAGRKLRQWRPYCGGTSACEPVDAPVIVEQTSRFFAQVGMVGPCSMEFKRDPRDGTFYLIEPTVCRPDWQSGLADANGVPVVYGAYCAALGLPLPAPRRRRLRRRWVVFGDDRRSAAHYIRRRELGRLAWLWSIHPPIRGAFFALDDPGPYLAILGATARRGLRKLGRLSGRGATPKTLA